MTDTQILAIAVSMVALALLIHMYTPGKHNR